MPDLNTQEEYEQAWSTLYTIDSNRPDQGLPDFADKTLNWLLQKSKEKTKECDKCVMRSSCQDNIVCSEYEVDT